MILLIGVGGAFGSIVRYELGIFIQKHSTHPIPFGTILINITGAFLLGLLNHYPVNHSTYLLLSEGFLGAYTTFSTFMYEGFHLLNHHTKWNASIYILGTIILGVLGYTLGYLLVL